MSYIYRSRRYRLARRLAIVLPVALAPVACTTVLLHEVQNGFGATDGPKAFLRDVREGRYASAYDRLCHDYALPESRAVFIARMQADHERGRGITSWKLRAEYGKETLSFDTVLGTVRTHDGRVQHVEFSLASDRGCLQASL